MKDLSPAMKLEATRFVLTTQVSLQPCRLVPESDIAGQLDPVKAQPCKYEQALLYRSVTDVAVRNEKNWISQHHRRMGQVLMRRARGSYCPATGLLVPPSSICPIVTLHIASMTGEVAKG